MKTLANASFAAPAFSQSIYESTRDFFLLSDLVAIETSDPDRCPDGPMRLGWFDTRNVEKKDGNNIATIRVFGQSLRNRRIHAVSWGKKDDGTEREDLFFTHYCTPADLDFLSCHNNFQDAYVRVGFYTDENGQVKRGLKIKSLILPDGSMWCPNGEKAEYSAE